MSHATPRATVASTAGDTSSEHAVRRLSYARVSLAPAAASWTDEDSFGSSCQRGLGRACTGRVEYLLTVHYHDGVVNETSQLLCAPCFEAERAYWTPYLLSPD